MRATSASCSSLYPNDIAPTIHLAVVAVEANGFVLLVAFDKPRVAQLLAPGLSLGILLGALVIVVSWIVTWIYVRWANDNLDRRVSELRAQDHQP